MNFSPAIKGYFYALLLRAAKAANSQIEIKTREEAERWGIPQRTIDRWLKFFRERGWLKLVDGRGGRGRGALYEVTWLKRRAEMQAQRKRERRKWQERFAGDPHLRELENADLKRASEETSPQRKVSLKKNNSINDLPPTPPSPSPPRKPWYMDLDETEWSFTDPERLFKRAHRKFRVLFEHYLPRGPTKVIQVAVGVIVKALEGKPKETWIEVYRLLRRALRDHVLKIQRWLSRGLRAWAAYIRKLVNQILEGRGLGWEAKLREKAREISERRVRRTEEYLAEVERWREEALAQKEKLKRMPSINDFATIEEWAEAVNAWADEVERREKEAEAQAGDGPPEVDWSLEGGGGPFQGEVQDDPRDQWLRHHRGGGRGNRAIGEISIGLRS